MKTGSKLAALLAESARYYRRINLNLSFEYHNPSGSYTLVFTPTVNGNIVFTDMAAKTHVNGELVEVSPETPLSSYSYIVEVNGRQVNPRKAVQIFFDDYLDGILTLAITTFDFVSK